MKHEGRLEALEEKNENFDLDSLEVFEIKIQILNYLEGKETISAKEIVELMRGF